MNKQRYRVLAWLALPLLLTALLPITATGQEQAPTPVAFEGVVVAPMDREGVIPDQTVVVQDGRITSIGPVGEVAIPEDVFRVKVGLTPYEALRTGTTNAAVYLGTR